MRDAISGDSRQVMAVDALIGGINGIFVDNTKEKHKIRLEIPDNQ